MNWAIELTNKQNHNPRPREADIYGIILYTEGNPQIKKLLDDDDYWNALDEWSGPQWAVFATRVKKGTMEYPEMPHGFMGYMVPVWKEPRENKSLFEKFEISPFQQLPILLVFAKCDTGEILQRAIKITDTSIDNAASSLKKSLTSISDALQSVLDENLRNTLGVYSAVSLNLDHDDGWKIMKKGVNLWKELRSFI